MPGDILCGSGLTIFDSDGKLRAAIYATAEGDSKFIAYDKTEQALADLASWMAELPYFLLEGWMGRTAPRWRFPEARRY